jgi:hypothetical protein
MKKFNLLVVLLITCLIGIPNVFAASASISVKASNKTVVVGSTTKVTVTVSSSDLGAWEYCISYDSSVLKLTSSTADANTCVKTGYVTKTGQTSSSETFTFKALKSGSANVTVKGYAVYAYSNESALSTSIGSVSIKTLTQAELEATYSSNANLSSLGVDGYTLSPEFDKNTFEYYVEVENDIESATITASKEDANSTISGTGDVTLTEGDNKFEIVVTAQKGNSQTYIVNINRKELDPIKVTVSNSEYTLVRRSDALPQYPTFVSTTINYEENEIPALYSEITGYTIIGLKDSDANIKMFIYDDGKFTPYNEISGGTLTIYPESLPKNNSFKNLKKVTIEYNGVSIDAYQVSEDSNFAIIYAQNIETGDVSYYTIDKKNGTIQEYNKELIDKYNSTINLMKLIILGFIVLVIILLLVLILRKPKKIIIKNTEEKLD